MPTSIRNSRPARDAGFTLIELMVVLFLIGLATAAIVLAMPGDGAKVDHDAQRFAARLAAARDAAVTGSRAMGVWVGASGYGFEQRTRGGWQALEARPFATTDWSRGVTLASGDGRPRRVRFDAVGLPQAPATFRLSAGDRQRTVSLDAAGEVSVGG